MKHVLIALVVALGCNTVAHAADASRFLLTQATLQKIRDADADVKKLGLPDDAQDTEDQSLEDTIRSIDRNPRLKAVLARHGLSSTEFALSVHATMHASAYLLFEKSLEPKAAAATRAGYTPEQRANIEVLRSRLNLGK